MDDEQTKIPDDAVHVGDVHSPCPECGVEVPIPVYAWIAGEVGAQTLETQSDMSDMWAHNFTHEGDAR